MLDSCLPATGPDEWVIALLIAAAVVLLVAGIVFVARSKARVALFLVPVAALTLALGAPTAPAQAVATAIPGFTFTGDWLGSSTTSFSPDDPYTPEQVAAIEQLEDLVQGGAGSVFTIELVGDGEGETGTMSADDLSFGDDGYPELDDQAVDEFFDEWDLPITITVTWTVSYADDCGKPLETVIVWTGDLSLPA